ncbi:MAG: dimethylsulfonioproprionate lyase family protein [Rhodospirillaceae bacterium]
MHIAQPPLDTAPLDLPKTRLSERPDWRYVLMEYYNVYRYASAGGSKLIGGHMRTVQSRLSKALSVDPEIKAVEPALRPVCSHLGRALDNGEGERTHSFVRAIGKIRKELRWELGYDSMPRSLENNYAYSELVGPRGPIVCEDLVLGLVLFAPRCVYPAHSHHHITESYFCLSGFVSQNSAGVYPPGSLLYNASGHEHAITTSRYEPVLLAYVWVGEPDTLAQFQMTFKKRAGRKKITP